MGTIAFQITNPTIVYSTVYSDADQRKHQSSASLAFVWGIHRRPVNSPHKWPVTRKMFPFDDVIMYAYYHNWTSWVQVIACRMFGAKPLSEPAVAYCPFGLSKYISMKLKSKYNNIHWIRLIWKCCLQTTVRECVELFQLCLNGFNCDQCQSKPSLNTLI